MSGNNEQQKMQKAIAEGKLKELKFLLTGLDSKELAKLNKFLNDPAAFSDEISGLLPIAIKKLFDRGDINPEQLQSLVEEALKESVKRNPYTLSDILFPVMMPAIRKAVAEDIKRMMDSVNNTLEKSFSPQRLGWRIQSLFSGKSYAEIALAHAYIYNVKQVFLIHKETGLLLSQAGNDEKLSSNADMVSSMLAAIKDFVQDSFKSKEDNELQTLKIGNLNILIEQGPYAIIAAVVEGNVPEEYKVLLKETIETIHGTYAYELSSFNGDSSVFEKDTSLLEACLQMEKKSDKPKKPVFAIVLLLLILLALGYLLYGYIDNRLHFNKLVNTIRNTPGMTVTEKGKHWFGDYYIYILKDPASAPLDGIIKASGADTSLLQIHTKSYISLDEAMILKRIKKELQPPPTVNIYYKNGAIIIEGTAESTWISQAKQNTSAFVGITRFEFRLKTNKKTEKRVSRKKVIKNNLAIEKHRFTFKYNTFELTKEQKREFEQLISEVNNLLNFNFNQDSVPIIIINSYTSYKGNTKANKTIAKHRAEQFINMLIEKGIPMESLVPKVKFIEDEGMKYPIRTVTFKIKYIKPGKND